MIRDTPAIAFGLATFLILHVGYLYLEASIANAFLVMTSLFFATPVLAGGVTGYLARHQPILSLVVLGVAIVVCIGALHLLGSRFGIGANRGDAGGTLALGVFSLVFLLPMVVVGGAIGAYIARARA